MAAGSVQHLKGSPGAFFGACPLVKPCDRNILKILHLAEEMISLADQLWLRVSENDGECEISNGFEFRYPQFELHIPQESHQDSCGKVAGGGFELSKASPTDL